VNTSAPWPELEDAEARVRQIQTKLHRWAGEDPDRRFDDVFNLVADPAFLMVAWARVRGNRGARTAGVDGVTPRSIIFGTERLLAGLRAELKARTFQPLPVREKLIPKPGGRVRGLGIPTTRDRVVQASLKLVLEPIFEADFKPVSYGFRPRRRAQDAIAEIHHFTSRSYEWVVEGDIEACFDNIDHTALMDRVRRRVGDKRVLALIKAFLKAGILTEDGQSRDTITGTPQGGILSPLLANIALSVLDDHFVEAWEADMAIPYRRRRRRRQGLGNYRLVRYADDWVIMVSGTRAHAEALRHEAAAVLAPMGLRLSEHKTRISHIDEGLDFLGMRIRRHKKRGANRYHVYTYPTRASLASVKAKVKEWTTRRTKNLPLSVLLKKINTILRGWTNYHRHGASSRTFHYLNAYTWRRVWRWIRAKHPTANVRERRRRYMGGGWVPNHEGVELFNPAAVSVTRYLYRGANITTPWATTSEQPEPMGLSGRLCKWVSHEGPPPWGGDRIGSL
jgi:RNA-directed DNA polymerase